MCVWNFKGDVDVPYKSVIVKWKSSSSVLDPSEKEQQILKKTLQLTTILNNIYL